MDKFSYIGNGDVSAIEELYESYLKDETSVDETWKQFFGGFEFARKTYDITGAAASEGLHKEFKVINLINGYRTRGHLFTKTNPVRTRRPYKPNLDLENFGLTEADMDTVFQAGTEIGIGPTRLRDIVTHMKRTYCQSIGVEYMYIRVPKVVNWLRERMEGTKNQTGFTSFEKMHILHKLSEAVLFEKFLHTKYVGQKRFSLEGGETVIPALDTVVEHGSELGIEAFVLGMAHRGRLNVLANIMRKDYSDIFSEFEGKGFEDDSLFDGDVKYHLGFSSDYITNAGKNAHLTLAPNPSHLEAVAPVVEGIARAKIDQKFKGDATKLCPILIHGDAAVAGQGIVYEVVQMAQLDGYRTGGTIHIVINNQVGFTTNYLDGRSSTYCTDVGKVTLSPIFHVNGDDVEAVVHAVRMALEFRQTFGRDVFIDLLGYRKHGHNEGDEPRFTQPLLYKAIAKHPDPRKIYLDKLLLSGAIDQQTADEAEKEFNDMLQGLLDKAKTSDKGKKHDFLRGDWKGIRESKPKDFENSPETGVDKRTLKRVAKAINTLPDDMPFFKKIRKIFEDREKMIENNQLDWGMAELLAYGTLLEEGHPVRFSGQDVQRGTFSHRHAVVRLEESEEEYTPLNHISKKQAHFMIYNSLLSEYGVLGFEYGYAFANPKGLTIWEGQFGDFYNGAQIIVDQFLSAAEDKWKKSNGIVLLLPHGYEGMGAEHSSARLERWLQLCAEDNMQIVNCTTPGNFFHALRRQLHRPFRKPLIVFSPKKLLRYPRCVSSLDELAKGGFREVIDDETADPKKTGTVVLCSGKFAYDLIEAKETLRDASTAIVRLEQLYPLPEKQLKALVKKYNKAGRWLWAQEEPENMGAWSFMKMNFTAVDLQGISIPASAAPATGSYIKHEKRHREVIDKVFEKTKKAKDLAIE